MRPLYTPNKDHSLGYGGNKIFKPMKKISDYIPISDLKRRVTDIHNNVKFWASIIDINHTINTAAHQYFDGIGSKYVLLPITTRMISSPGALYGKEKLDYTQDTIPVKLKWFDLKKDIFLSESSQIYLELYLVNRKINSVYSVYNSFRKEKSDSTHLSEFHHMEYEGKVNQKTNEKIVLSLVQSMIKRLLKDNLEDLSYFLFDDDLDYLNRFARSKKVCKLTFEQAMDTLYRVTGEHKYKKITGSNFGSWEEVKLSSEFEEIILLENSPLYEVAFYHAPLQDKGKLVADNADFIWPYYREFVGSGHRVRSLKELLIKARKFNLPRADYHNYVLSRRFNDYVETSGFGLGWERFLQGLLKLPYIYLTVPFPRVHSTIYP
jgi:aspartyl/asparaginyl-tRNA synthetase